MSNYPPPPPPPGYGYPPPGHGYPPPPLPPPKPSNAGKIIGFGCLGLVALLIFVMIVGVIAGSDSDDSSASPPVAEQPEPPAQEEAPAEPEPEKKEEKPKPKPKGPPTSFGDGTYLVGEDIKAGTYKTTGPQENAFFENCYWSRNKDDSGELGSIIANNNTKGPARVTLNKGEVFQTNGCEKWKLVG